MNSNFPSMNTVVTTTELMNNVKITKNRENACKFANVFKQNLLALLDKAHMLITSVNSHPDVTAQRVLGTSLSPTLLNVARAYADTEESQNLARGFIKRSIDYWDKIASKDMEFLTGNAAVLFKDAPQKQVEEFQKVFTLNNSSGTKLLNNHEINGLWTIFHAMVSTCVKYIYYCKDFHDDENGKGYRNAMYFGDVDIKIYVKMFNVKITN